MRTAIQRGESREREKEERERSERAEESIEKEEKRVWESSAQQSAFQTVQVG